jgi:hypothetical protein
MMYIGSVNKECSPGEVRTDGVKEGKKRKREERRENARTESFGMQTNDWDFALG